MSIPNLPVNFKDDILASSNPKRKYRQTENDDSTVSFEDVTNYSQEGSRFGAKEVNQTNTAINNIYTERILALDELELVTEPGFFVDAKAVKEGYDELNGKMSLKYGVGSLFQVRAKPDNLIYGAYAPGIYYFSGSAQGVPVNGYSGAMLVFRESGTSNMIKLALSADGSIHRMVQRSDGEVAQNWKSVW